MARARKLFPIYGSALANNMFAALDRDRVVARFVASYVAEYDRRGILGGPARDRELAETIGREIVLAMILEVRQALPSFFGKKQIAKLDEDERQSIDLFFRELTAALGRVWDWTGEDRRQFLRDLALYFDFGSRPNAVVNTRKRGAPRKGSRGNARAKSSTTVQITEAPFVGRVALLLDPSMLDQARRAARKLHADAGRLAQKLLRQTLRPGR
jgi:hypothetical protein